MCGLVVSARLRHGVNHRFTQHQKISSGDLTLTLTLFSHSQSMFEFTLVPRFALQVQSRSRNREGKRPILTVSDRRLTKTRASVTVTVIVTNRNCELQQMVNYKCKTTYTLSPGVLILNRIAFA
jgi:hypothetical protein